MEASPTQAVAGWCAVPVGGAGADGLVSEASPEDGGPGGTPGTYVSPFSLGGADDEDGVDFNPEDYSEVSVREDQTCCLLR